MPSRCCCMVVNSNLASHYSGLEKARCVLTYRSLCGLSKVYLSIRITKEEGGGIKKAAGKLMHGKIQLCELQIRYPTYGIQGNLKKRKRKNWGREWISSFGVYWLNYAPFDATFKTHWDMIDTLQMRSKTV